jgi:hypothetical protein
MLYKVLLNTSFRNPENFRVSSDVEFYPALCEGYEMGWRECGVGGRMLESAECDLDC